MSTATKSPVMIYTEQTPNPQSLKFVTNRLLYRGTADFREAEIAQKWSPLATALFEQPYTKGIYISNNFVTITKDPDEVWENIMIEAKKFIKNYVNDGGEIISEGYEAAQKEMEAAKRAAYQYTGDEDDTVKKIKELIDTYVKPAVEMDGGNIEFKSFNEGIVTVTLQGSCSGCPSSEVTLKSGIEGMLKRMLPEVTEVVSEME